ncbi:hypothetical protein D3C84_454480 [compost metagenome]
MIKEPGHTFDRVGGAQRMVNGLKSSDLWFRKGPLCIGKFSVMIHHFSKVIPQFRAIGLLGDICQCLRQMGD